MRRTARALSVALVAGAALALAGPAASADPAADTGPASAPPGRSASAPPGRSAPVSAACDAGTAPDAERTAGGACPAATGGPGTPWSTTYDVTGGGDGGDVWGDGAGDQCRGAETCQDGRDGQGGKGGVEGQDGQGGKGGVEGQDGQGGDDGPGCRGEACPDGSPCKEKGPCADTGRECTGATGTGAEAGSCAADGGWCEESRGAPCPDGQACRGSHASDGCAQASGQGGVDAGTGGSFNDSVPALVAGGLFIAAACGGAAYRIHGRRRSA
ncbi:hypothetical protein ACGFT2_05695 [Streptomyces sp. NPDC048514]|uniref:hypothetical protein n=1 Tax=Streptomyces sp. NPDC048514 TaxID=3365564 RepID=UPI0037147773